MPNEDSHENEVNKKYLDALIMFDFITLYKIKTTY